MFKHIFWTAWLLSLAVSSTAVPIVDTGVQICVGRAEVQALALKMFRLNASPTGLDDAGPEIRKAWAVEYVATRLALDEIKGNRQLCAGKNEGN